LWDESHCRNRAGSLEKDWTAKLDEKDFAGQIEFVPKWLEGTSGMTVVSAGKLRKD